MNFRHKYRIWAKFTEWLHPWFYWTNMDLGVTMSLITLCTRIQTNFSLNITYSESIDSRCWNRVFLFPCVWQGSERKGTLVVQSLRNTLMETILTATITILITLAMAALTNNTFKASYLFTSAFFGSQTGKTIVLKYGSATIFLVASFLCSSMALGFLIDANFLVNALGEFSTNPRHTETIFERGFTLAFVGDRVLCMTFPLLFWMFGPIPVVVSSFALVWGLHERDFTEKLSRNMNKSCTWRGKNTIIVVTNIGVCWSSWSNILLMSVYVS